MAEEHPATADGCLWYPQAPASDYPRLSEVISTDVLVVGGGYCGLTAALSLRRRGLRTCVIDARTIAGGASGRNGGQLVPGFKIGPNDLQRRFGSAAGRSLFEFGQRAPSIVSELVATLGIECELARNGWIKAAHTGSARIKVDAEYDELNEAGADARRLDRDELAARVGDSSYVGGLELPGGGTLNPYAYCIGLAAALRRLGGEIYTETPALAIERQRSEWRVRVPEAAILADTVIVATDGYTEGLLPSLSRSIIRVGSFQVATDPLPAATLSRVVGTGIGVSDTRVLLRYFRRTADGRLVVGGRGAFSDRTDPSLFAAIERSIAEIYPGIGFGSIATRWHGMVALTADSLPHIVRLGSGLFFAGGFNGRGVAMATAFGQLLAAVVSGEERDHPLIDERPRQFSFHRLRAPLMAVGARMLGLREWIST